MSAPPQAVEFDEATHTYRVGGILVPNVSRICEPLCNWDQVPPDILDRACELGTAVHLATEFDDRGTLVEASLSDEVGGYLDAWRRFRRETGFVPTAIERQVFHPQMRYAGRLDREGAYKNLPTMPTIIDIKSGGKYRAHGVSIAGYALARKAEAGWPSYPARRAVYLHKDGRYESVPFTRADDYPTFVGLLTLHNWRSTP